MEFAMQNFLTFPILTEEQEENIFNVNNPQSPFYNYVGNEEAVNMAFTISKSCFLDLGHYFERHCFRRGKFRILITGPKSVCKTSFAQKFHAWVGTDYSQNKVIMPFVEIDGANTNSLEEILVEIERGCISSNIPIQYNDDNGLKQGHCPTITVFIDEVHGLPKKVAESLLKATESNDGKMLVAGKCLDCRDVNFVLATTDPGILKPAFKSRFIEINLRKHTISQLGKIIKIKYPNWSQSECEKLSKMKPVPRQLLMVADFVQTDSIHAGRSVEESIGVISKQFGLDESGISKRALDVLEMLNQSPQGLSKKNICASMNGMSIEELENDVMPYLMPSELHPAYISIGSKHKITKAGIEKIGDIRDNREPLSVNQE
jgi:hypothetical protein